MRTPHPTPRRSAAEQAHFESLLRDLFEHKISFNEVLGFRIVSFDVATPRVRLEMRPGIGKHFDATAQVVRLGGRIGSVQMQVSSDDGTLVATAAGAFVIS